MPVKQILIESLAEQVRQVIAEKHQNREYMIFGDRTLLLLKTFKPGRHLGYVVVKDRGSAREIIVPVEFVLQQRRPDSHEFEVLLLSYDGKAVKARHGNGSRKTERNRRGPHKYSVNDAARRMYDMICETPIVRFVQAVVGKVATLF